MMLKAKQLEQVTNDDADEQGDSRDHVTERWRHPCPVALVGIAVAYGGGVTLVRVGVAVDWSDDLRQTNASTRRHLCI